MPPSQDWGHFYWSLTPSKQKAGCTFLNAYSANMVVHRTAVFATVMMASGAGVLGLTSPPYLVSAPKSISVSDYRLSDSFPAQDKWATVLPSLEAIAEKATDRGDQSAIPIGVIVSVSALVFGGFAGLSFIAKTKGKGMKHDEESEH